MCVPVTGTCTVWRSGSGAPERGASERSAQPIGRLQVERGKPAGKDAGHGLEDTDWRTADPR